MASVEKITPCLWFDSEAEEAARFYCSIFGDSGIERVTRYGREGFEIHGRPAGSVLTVTFRLAGQHFTALNGGPLFKFTEAVSLVVRCENQEEIDHFWTRLGEGGEPKAQQCGWLKDRYGLSWQVVPSGLHEMFADPDAQKTERLMRAVMQMKKLDFEALRRAFEGK
jgi:predicted 3-demethylubiquinone-9 3-methyltransferase (glyoxalase superfamily)